MTYVYFKYIFSIVLPLLLINFLLQFLYKINLITVSGWWLKNFLRVEYKGTLTVGLLLCFFALWLAISSIIQIVSLSLYSNTHKMMYAGNISDNTSLLYYADDLSITPIKYYNFEMPTGSFKHIYTTTEFLKDKGTSRIGTPSEGDSLRRLFTICWIMLALSPIILVVLHAYVYPVMIKAETLHYDTSGMRVAFNDVYLPFGITPIHMLIFSIVMLTSLFFIPVKNKKDFSGYASNQVISLPSYVKPNYEIYALPVESKREIIDSMNNNYDSDSGFRTVIYKFEKDFPLPVYISYRYDSKLYPELEAISREHIKNKEMMKINILNDLSIQPVLE